MATQRELESIARAALHLIEKEHITPKMAVLSALRSHKDIVWSDGIMKEIGKVISTLKKNEGPQKKIARPKQKPAQKHFPTHAEMSLPKKDD